jgi:hypothetical protein
MSASIATPIPAPMAPSTGGMTTYAGRGGVAATEDCSRIAVGVLFCDDGKQAVGGARYEPDRRAVGEISCLSASEFI